MKPAAGLLVIAVLVAPCVARAQAVPGNARGSQTGDGAGAFTGLASAPEANLFSGVAQTSIPIEVPPGRLGLAPVLALSYSSSGGPGPFGYGWTLPIPRIHRSTRHGLPRYDDTDTFVLEMPGAMVELERIPGSPRGFRPVVEGTFPRIGFHDGDNSWKVIDKLGVAFVFGPSAATRTGRGTSRDDTFAWLLASVEDPAGNRIEFSYRARTGSPTSSGLPDVVRYGANSHTGSPHFAEVRFSWAPLAHAGPPMVSWREGWPDALDARIAAVETFTHGLRARRYDFSLEEDAVTADLRLVGATLTAYGDDPSADVRLPSTVFVYAPSTSSGWPAVGSATDLAGAFEVPAAGVLRYDERSITIDSLDLDGDGIVDRVDSGPQPPVVRLGNGRGFGEPRTWNWPTATGAPRTVRRSDGNGNLLGNVFDLDGDGFADLVDSSPAACGAPAGTWCVWKGSAGGFADAPLRWAARATTLRATADSGAKIVGDLVDIDADGRPDLVDASGFDASSPAPAWNVYRNDGSGFESVATRFPAPVPYLSRSEGARVVYALFDINADGLPDVVSADPEDAGGKIEWAGYAAWRVFLNEGDRFAATASAWPVDGGVGRGPGLPNFVSLRASDGTTTADLFDITGDGRPDLVRRFRRLDGLGAGAIERCDRPSRCTIPDDDDDSAVSPGFCCYDILVFANTGSSFAQPVTWSSPVHGLRAGFDSCPFGASLDCRQSWAWDFDFFDFDGDGLVDFVERYTAAGRPGSWLVHPHPAGAPAGGARPNLMLAMRNGIGGETMLRYRAAAGTPDTRLPFPHWVVRERELRDSVYDGTPLVTSFAYRGGWFDPVDREMRGFARVQSVDPVGVTRVRDYHQDRRRAGRLLREWTLEPPPCAPADASDPDDPCSPWRFPMGTTDYDWPDTGPVLLARESDVPWHGGSPVEDLRVTTSYGYDGFGNVTRRRVETPMATATTTTTAYVHRVADKPGGMPDRYNVAKPASARTEEDGRSSPLVEKAFDYDWKSSAPGSLSTASTCMEWDASGCSRWSRRSFSYDAFGNVTVARGPEGATSRTEYDADGLFATRSVDPAGLETRASTEPRGGRVVATVAPNGSVVESRYDGLGRLVATWGPGTSAASPLRRFDYAPGSLGDAPPRMTVTSAGSGASTAFFDGLGRGVATKTASRSGRRDVSVVSGLRRYDDRGLVVAEALPFDSADLDVTTLVERFGDAPAWLAHRYDAAGRRTATEAPDGTLTRVDTSAPGIVRTDDANATSGAWPGATTLEIRDGLGHLLLRDACSARPTEAAPYDCPPGALARRESWTYDGLGRMTEARTSALGAAAGDSVARITRDGLGSRTSLFHSDAGTWSFRNDGNGRLVEVVKPDGSRLTTTWDAAGRILRRRGPTSSATYRYQSSGGGTGKLRRATTRTRSARISEDFAYDARGRVVSRRRRVSPRGAAAAELTTHYGYDDLDRLVATSCDGWDGDGEDVLTTEFDAFGRPASLRSEATTYVASAEYDSAGRPLRIDYGNGLSDLVAFEERSNAAHAAGFLRCARTTATASAATGACGFAPGDLDGRGHAGYDASGNLLAADDAVHDAADPRREDLRYQYDALGRLVSAGPAGPARERFAFDPLGNLTRNGGLLLEYADTGHPGRLTSTRDASGSPSAVAFDANGRRIRDGDRTYGWDDTDRLASVWQGGRLVAEYGSTDGGERAYRHDADSGAWQFELGDGIRIDGGEIERTVVFGGRAVAVERRPVARRSGAAPRETTRVFLHHDHQQSVRLVTDAAGQAVEHDRYRAFGGLRLRLDAAGRRTDDAATRVGYTGHLHDEGSGLVHFGARDYDPSTGSYLSLDPRMQFASPYAYSDGNPVAGRDADGTVFQLTAIEILVAAVGTAAFVDSLASSGDLGHSLTAGVFAGFSVYFSSQLSTAFAQPLVQSGHTYLQLAATVASDGFGALQAAEAIEDGRYAGGIVAAGMLAASLIGIETAGDPGPGETDEDHYARHGIRDRGEADGKTVIDVNGICSTRPGCLSNTLTAARENLRVLFGGKAQCVGGCEYVTEIAERYLRDGKDVLLRCNSFGAIKCLGALQGTDLATYLGEARPRAAGQLTVEMSGAPLLRPPRMQNLTYQVNLFDPVVWVGTAYSTPARSDVVLGRNWWVPAPVVVHHSRMYEKPFFEALGEMVP